MRGVGHIHGRALSCDQPHRPAQLSACDGRHLHLERTGHRRLPGGTPYRHQGPDCLCSVALYRAAPVRRDPHGAATYPRRRPASASDKDGCRAGYPSACRTTGRHRCDAGRASDIHHHQDRQPYSGNDFSEQFRAWCDTAELPKACSPHGLRKAACRRLAEAGCSANEIAAISGHATLSEVQRYTKAADQARMARNAMARQIKIEKEAAN
jgi:integrase